VEAVLECIGSSGGLRAVLRLLYSLPEEMTVKELKKRVIEETLFVDYHQRDGRRHTHWKTRVFAVLEETPDLPEEMLRHGIDKIFGDVKRQKTMMWPAKRTMAEWTSKLFFVPNLPEDLRKEFLEANHKHCEIPKEVKKALNRFLPLWLSNVSRTSPPLEERDGVFLFSNTDHWRLLDQSEKGALIYASSYYGSRVEIMAVLLPDVSNKGEGCAIEVAPLAKTKTVHQAIAWMYQQDPKRWKGFDKEV